LPIIELCNRSVPTIFVLHNSRLSTPDPDITRCSTVWKGTGSSGGAASGAIAGSSERKSPSRDWGVLEELDGWVSELQTRHLGHFDTRELTPVRQEHETHDHS